ncbi:unnamed protein product [Ectocarpus sp. 12 AP-2014]
MDANRFVYCNGNRVCVCLVGPSPVLFTSIRVWQWVPKVKAARVRFIAVSPKAGPDDGAPVDARRNDVLDYRVFCALYYMTRWCLPRVTFRVCFPSYVACCLRSRLVRHTDTANVQTDWRSFDIALSLPVRVV